MAQNSHPASEAEDQRGELSGSCDQREDTTNVYYNSTVRLLSLQVAKYVSRECTGSTHFRKYASDAASVDWNSLVSHNAFCIGQQQHPMEMFTNV